MLTDSATNSFSLAPGTKLLSFIIKRELGSGGFGITYYAEHPHLNDAVAIKEYFPPAFASRLRDGSVVPKSNWQNREFYEYGLTGFLQEVKLLKQCGRHPHIVYARDYVEENGTAYILMDFEAGQTLEARLNKMNSPPTEDWLKTIFVRLLDGLGVVHDNQLLHRDIKPDNIYLRTNDDPLLIDFGSARSSLDARSPTSKILYAEGYSPKEQRLGATHQTAASDIYSVGATLRRAISGSMPISSDIRSDANNSRSRDPMIPAHIAYKDQYSLPFLKTIDWCMAVDARDRPQDVRTVQNCLLYNKLPEQCHEFFKTLTNVGEERLERADITMRSGKTIPSQNTVTPEYASLTTILRPAPCTTADNASVSRNSANKTLIGFCVLLIAVLFGLAWKVFAPQYFQNSDNQQGRVDINFVDSNESSVQPSNENRLTERLGLAERRQSAIEYVAASFSVDTDSRMRSLMASAQEAMASSNATVAKDSLDQLSELQINVLSTAPRKYTVGSTIAQIDSAYDQCVESTGGLTCIKSWFERERMQTFTLAPFSIDEAAVSFREFAKYALERDVKTEAEIKGFSRQLDSSTYDYVPLRGFNWRAPEGPGSTYRDFMDHPVVHVSYRDATEYCNHLNKRLPSTAEWEFAISYGKPRLYPGYFETLTVPSPQVNSSVLGSFKVRSEKIFDASSRIYGGTGNVAEWTTSTSSPGKQVRYLKGGSWNEISPAFMRIAALRAESQDSTFIDVGVRCATDLKKWAVK